MFGVFISKIKQAWLAYSTQIVDALPKERLLALDVFRGLTITAMVLVNNPGNWSYVYSPLLHAKWHGLTPTDLIFPFFVFIIGVSIAIVTNRQLGQTVDNKTVSIYKLKIMQNAGVRALKLFALGLFLALFYYEFSTPNYSWVEQQLQSIRVMGVLQRLGLVFFLTMAIVVFCKRWWQWVMMAFLLAGYWLAMMCISYQDADGNVYQGVYLHGNSLAAWVDAYLFADKHLYYQAATPFAFDPEGVLSTIPAISGCLIGVFTGNLLINKTVSLATKTKQMMLAGLLLLIAGYLWSLSFPINKAIWTSSFVFVTSGWALIILAVLTFVIDMKGYRYWSAPFVVFGANAIFFYMFSGVIARVLMMIPMGEQSLHAWLFNEVYQPLFGNYNGSLVFAVVFLLWCYVVMHWLYKKKIFFKV